MLKADIEHLSVPFEPSEAEQVDTVLAKRLSVYIPALDSLEAEIEADLDPKGFGVSWWSTHQEDKRRILISDHLFIAVSSIQKNLCEAAIHLLEVREAWEKVSVRLSRAVQRDGRTVFPTANAPIDAMPHWMGTLHIAGHFRALGSALDCLAATCIGVAGLPMDILKADFHGVQRHLREASTPLFQTLGRNIDEAVSGAGPAGWLRWCNDYRNMYVHRARRNELGVFKVSSHVVDAKGHPILRTTPVTVLLKAPAASEVESFLQFRQGPLTLSESAERTMQGALKATTYLAKEVTSHLLSVWRERRNTPTLVLQPDKQWSSIADTPSGEFTGFEPGSLELKGSELIANPNTVARLQRAGLSAEDVFTVWK